MIDDTGKLHGLNMRPVMLTGQGMTHIGVKKGRGLGFISLKQVAFKSGRFGACSSSYTLVSPLSHCFHLAQEMLAPSGCIFGHLGMFRRPAVHRLQHRPQGLTTPGQRIFDMRRHGLVVAPNGQAVFLHLLELQRELAMGDSAQCALKLVNRSGPSSKQWTIWNFQRPDRIEST